MTMIVTQLYKSIDETKEYCFNVETVRELSPEEMRCLRQILADGFLPDSVTPEPALAGERVVEIGLDSTSRRPGRRTWFPSARPQAWRR